VAIAVRFLSDIVGSRSQPGAPAGVLAAATTAAPVLASALATRLLLLAPVWPAAA